MFAYNPTPDRSAEIMLEGMQNFGQSIAAGLEKIGEGYAKANENKMTSDYLDKMANFYSTVKGPDGTTNLMTADDLEKFSKLSLGAKQGMIAPRQAAYDQMLQNSYIEKQMAAHMQRTNYGAQVNNQVPMNQQPMAPLGTYSSANNATPQQQSIFSNPNIRTADQFGQ